MKKFFLLMLLLSASTILAFSCNSQKETVFYVALDGNDSWSGKLTEPNSGKTDGPFATLEKARDAVRLSKKDNPAKPVNVLIRGGVYSITKTLALTAEDSGSVKAPVVWSAYNDEKVIFTGGKTIGGFAKISDAGALSRINKACADSIFEADLSSAGIENFGDINPVTGKRIELYFKNKLMTISRFPNNDWLIIADVPQTGPKRINEGLDRDKSPVPRGRHYGRFTYSGDRPNGWTASENIWVHGYWTWDWSDEYLKVAKLDKSKKEITPVEPHHSFGYTKGQRFYFLNILEELDSPGEWYIDKDSKKLYFWPPEPVNDGDVVLSLLEDPMITMENVSNVTFQKIVFEATRGNVIKIKDGANNKIAGCEFLDLGLTAVLIDGGTNNGVLSCDIHDVSAGGVFLNGGDLKTLTPAKNYATNNHIYNFAQRIKTYQAAVQITGVGNIASHNRIHDAPHLGIFLVTSQVGNDHLIEFNELYALAKETGDVGAIYPCARNYAFRGTVIRHNYIHDLLGPGLWGVMGVYLDDFTSGVTIYGNVFYKAGRASFVGGGRNNTIENNIYVECSPSVHLDGRGLGWAKYYFANTDFQKMLDEVNYKNPPYSEKYPELLTLLNDEPAVPKYNKYNNNVSYGGKWFDFFDNLDFKVVEMKNNYIADPILCLWGKEKGEVTYKYGDKEMMDILTAAGNVVSDKDPGFVDVKNGNFNLKSDSPVFKLGFKPIPFDKIGLYLDEFRKVLPEKKSK